MIYEFEGKTEREAIEMAAAELGLETDEFDVEIVESQAGGLFKKGKVKIRVHVRDSAGSPGTMAGKFDLNADLEREVESEVSDQPARREKVGSDKPLIPNDEFERKMIAWTSEVVSRMGYPAKVTVLFREEKKLGLKIETESTAMVIGKKGKNIDALQLLANVYAGNLGREDLKIILDSENYRIRREESLVRIAYESAERVRRTGRSILLEPMNPFERRIIHTTLNDIVDIETKSEGEGLYKQVRVTFRGRK